jgi:hypothetical protein
VSYIDLNTIHNPATGTVAPAAWGDQIRENEEFLIDPPVVSVFHSVTVNVTTGTGLTILNANSENYDNDAMHSTVSNTSRLTVQTAGRYMFGARVNFDVANGGGATGMRAVELLHNSTTRYGLQLVSGASATLPTQISGVATIVCAAADFVEVQVRQDSGSTKGVDLLEFYAVYMTR